ncbi:DUF6262 family protein [Streptomyces sp. NPDC050485]|uniref:DUF6262 family protein n=1 Tax=Streptomyces sp. NPDC050485 TaxID=3365617 RepID=UPI00378ABCBE
MNPSLHDGRQAATSRRRERARAALREALAAGEPVSVSGIARRADLDRSFFYRHNDLLQEIQAAENRPQSDGEHGVTLASLRADLANANDRNSRLTARIRQLEEALSRALGERAWQESGLGAPTDIHALQERINQLEQHNADLIAELSEREEDLTAARAANRQLLTTLNTRQNLNENLPLE